MSDRKEGCTDERKNEEHAPIQFKGLRVFKDRKDHVRSKKYERNMVRINQN